MSGIDQRSLLIGAVGGFAVGAVVMKMMNTKSEGSFVAKLNGARGFVGKKNILSPADAKAFLSQNPKCLHLDVQDPGSPTVPGVYSASLGTLIFKACQGMTDFKDPNISDLPKNNPILVTCALGGQALFAGKLLVEYGFTNVKVVDGGCAAWKKGGFEHYPIIATCEISPKGAGGGGSSNAGCTGTITLEQTSADSCSISYEIKGLSGGFHGFHINEKADFSKGCASAGPIYNPFKKAHGGPHDEERMAGDLGNIIANHDGLAKGKLVDKFIKLHGENNVVGRSFVIHEDPDDFGTGDNSEPGPPPTNGKASKVTGNCGSRIGCGKIELKK